MEKIKRSGLLVLSSLFDGIAVLLMAFPIGVLMNRKAGPDVPVVQQGYSYFYFGLLGMTANGFPFLSAVLASIGFLLTVWLVICKQRMVRLRTTALLCLIAAAVLSILGQIMSGNYCYAGILITLLLTLSTAACGLQKIVDLKENDSEQAT